MLAVCISSSPSPCFSRAPCQRLSLRYCRKWFCPQQAPARSVAAWGWGLFLRPLWLLGSKAPAATRQPLFFRDRFHESLSVPSGL